MEENRRLVRYVNYELGHGKMKNGQIVKSKKIGIMTCGFDTNDDMHFEYLFDYDS